MLSRALATIAKPEKSFGTMPKSIWKHGRQNYSVQGAGHAGAEKVKTLTEDEARVFRLVKNAAEINLLKNKRWSVGTGSVTGIWFFALTAPYSPLLFQSAVLGAAIGTIVWFASGFVRTTHLEALNKFDNDQAKTLVQWVEDQTNYSADCIKTYHIKSLFEEEKAVVHKIKLIADSQTSL